MVSWFDFMFVLEFGSIFVGVLIGVVLCIEMEVGFVK